MIGEIEGFEMKNKEFVVLIDLLSIRMQHSNVVIYRFHLRNFVKLDLQQKLELL